MTVDRLKKWLEAKGCTTVVPCKDEKTGEEFVHYYYKNQSYPQVRVPAEDRIVWPRGSPLDLVMSLIEG